MTMNVNIFSLIPLAGAAISTALGILVFRSGTRALLARTFFVTSILLSAWNLHFVALYSISDLQTALYAASRFRWASILLQPTMLLLILALRDQISKPWRNVLITDYLLSLTLCWADMNGWVVTSLRHYSWGYYSVGGTWYSVFSFSVIANALLAAIALIAHYRSATEASTRHKLKFWLLGIAVAFPLGATNLLPAYGISFYPLGNLGNVFWASTIAYAIARHRLLDAGIVAARSAASLLALTSLLIPLSLLSVWLQVRDFGTASTELTVSFAILAGATAILFPNTRAALHQTFVRKFFPDKIATRDSLLALSRQAARTLDRDRLARELTIGLERILDAEAVLLAVRTGPSQDFIILSSIGYPSIGNSVSTDSALGAFFDIHTESLTISEAQSRSRERRFDAIADEMMHTGIELLLPLHQSGPPIGILALGRRAKYQPYTSEDVDALESLAAEAALALENLRLSQQLRMSQDLIQRADRSSALGVLAAGMAHEIRNPLVSIRTFLQLVPDRRDDEEFMTTFLKTASDEVERISRLINELLSFARSPSPVFDRVDLVELVESAVLLVNPQAKRSRVKVVHKKGVFIPSVHGSFEQLRQVVLNLVFNSIQACAATGTVTITTRTTQVQGRAFGEIEVSDDGCGIPPENIERLFDPFFTTRSSGTGLGLSIVKQIISEHGGTISVTSSPNVSTTFLVQIPVYTEPEQGM